jgi:hypothetical protein
MASRVVDTDRFRLEAAIIDWREQVIMRQRAGSALAGDAFDSEVMANRMKEEGVPNRLAQLRWSTRADVGTPTEPFRVWRRPILPFNREKELENLQFVAPIGGGVVVTWSRPLALVELTLDVASANALVFGYSGTPDLEGIVTFRKVNAGFQRVVLTGPALTGAILPLGATFQSATGIDGESAANADGWEEVEVVGFPAALGEWRGGHDQKQGLVGSLTDPVDAAQQRYLRGRSQFGWPGFLAPGHPAPPFEQPDAKLLVEEVRKQFLDMIRDLQAFPPAQQAQETVSVAMPPPEDHQGTAAPIAGSVAQLSPLFLLAAAVTADPHLSLVLGYGTAIEQKDLPTIVLGDRKLFDGPDDFDYMVTATWEKGIASDGAVTTLAALALRPHTAFAGPQPFGLTAVESQPLRPRNPDNPWRRSVRISWPRLPKTGLLRIASFATARRDVNPAEAPFLLNEKRDSGGFRAIAANAPLTRSPADPPETPIEAFNRLNISAMDPDVAIPSALAPNQNGFLDARYAAVTQTIFGLWGSWGATAKTIEEPAPDRVRILALSLAPTAAAGPCPATAVIEFGWDWSVRKPQSITFGGRLYAQAKRSDPPPSSTPPGNFPRSLAGAEPLITIAFNGDVPVVPAGMTMQGFKEVDDVFVPFGPQQGSEVRRYRLTIPGFLLNFDASAHIGLAVWARGIERKAPGRIGGWSQTPGLTSASDPRPPKIIIDYVDIASLPDANNECHARLAWPAAAGAVGYIIYEATETNLLADLGLPAATQEQTLSQRLMQIKARYDQTPRRTAFTRRIATLVTGNSIDMTLPRGSADIHFFAVLAENAGRIESVWPTAANNLIPIAAPKLAIPQPPLLEVRMQGPAAAPTGVQLRIETRLGHRVKRVSLYRTRVADAARQLDTMGPPIVELEDTSGMWSVVKNADGSIKSITGTDAPEGSWKRIWYRCVAWSADDNERALLKARSQASPAQNVLLPPAGPPDLSPITAAWPGGALEDVLLSWTSVAPVPETPAGHHRLSLDVRVSGTPSLTPPLLSFEQSLEAMATAASPATVVWREGVPAANGSRAYRARLKRASVDDALAVALRLRDPLGRMAEQLFSLKAGPIDPPPEMGDLVRIAKGTAFGVIFTSPVPTQVLLSGPYRLTIRANRVGPGPLRPPLLPLTPVLRAPAPGLGAGDLLAAPLPGLSPIRIAIAIPDVPLVDTANPSTGPINRLSVWRRKGLGGLSVYGAITGSPIRGLVVRITAPDGRFVEKTIEFT